MSFKSGFWFFKLAKDRSVPGVGSLIIFPRGGVGNGTVVGIDREERVA